MIRVADARASDAALVHEIMRVAFAEYVETLRPPSGANTETVADVDAAIRRGGAILAWEDRIPVGSARWERRDDALHVGRVAVLPEHRRRGVATALMRYCETIAGRHGCREIRIGVRESLPSNLGLYERLGYEVVAIETHPRGPDRVITMRKRVAG